MAISFPSILISIPEGVLDLSWGHPSPRLHALDVFQQAAAYAWTNTRFATLQYGAEQGFGPLLEALATFLSQQPVYGMTVTPESLFLTGGASQAIDLACTLFARQGDTIFVEEPNYYLVSKIFTDHHLQIVGVPTDADGLCTDADGLCTDADGLCTDALAAMLADPLQPSPTLLYTIPTYQNPSGSVLSLERRQALVELAQRHEVLLLSDDVYQLLHYGPPPRRCPWLLLTTWDVSSHSAPFRKFLLPVCVWGGCRRIRTSFNVLLRPVWWRAAVASII